MFVPLKAYMQHTAVALLGGALLFASNPARAQGPAGSRRVQADLLLQQARALMDSGQVAAACAKFEASETLENRLDTLLHLADCYERIDVLEGENQTLLSALVRPFRLLGTQPIVQILAFYMAYLYGLTYLLLSTFPQLWHGVYGESVGVAGLNYISLGIGLGLGAQVCAPMQDRIYAALKRHYNVDIGRPEFRIPLMVPGAMLAPIGLLIYGWCAEYRTHWIAPNIGVTIFSIGTVISFQCIQGYLVDTYTRYAASAVAAGTVLRSFGGFGFPLFAPYMYERLGYGWGNTTLALISIVIGWPAPILLWKYGETLRAKSTFAAGE